MPGRRSLGVINASLNDLSVPAEGKNFREDWQKLKVFSSEKFLVGNTSDNQHVSELSLEKMEIISCDAIALSLGK